MNHIDPWELAIALNIPGKGSPTGCSIFARALFERLVANHTPAAVLFFNWRGLSGPVLGIVDKHEICVYKDDKGRLFSVDATARAVTWLPTDIDPRDIPARLNPDKKCSGVCIVRNSELFPGDHVAHAEAYNPKPTLP